MRNSVAIISSYVKSVHIDTDDNNKPTENKPAVDNKLNVQQCMHSPHTAGWLSTLSDSLLDNWCLTKRNGQRKLWSAKIVYRMTNEESGRQPHSKFYTFFFVFPHISDARLSHKEVYDLISTQGLFVLFSTIGESAQSGAHPCGNEWQIWHSVYTRNGCKCTYSGASNIITTKCISIHQVIE